MTPRAYLSVRSLPLGYTLRQEEGIAWMKAGLRHAAETTVLPGADRAERYYDLLERKTNIQHRVTALEDYTHLDWDRMQLHRSPVSGDGEVAPGPPAPWHQAPLERRMELFAETANRVAHDAFASDLEAPDAIVQVSCTGYDSPSAVQRVIADRAWGDHARVLSVGHMGCYAALPALATAADVVSATSMRRVGVGDSGSDLEGDARAAIFLIELCTLHHHPATTDPEQIVQQCLFADGAARLDVSSTPEGSDFALLDHVEAIIPDTLGEMTWRPAGVAFQMTLSRRVPEHIQTNVAGVLEAFLSRNGLGVDDVDVFAVHPGGPRVIESTASALGIEDEKVAHSQSVLRDRGNMSSTTLPHIWERIASDAAVPSGALVCSVAFGPGLTVVGNLMRKA
ncbi:3-oxoacyl-[acyl-carrier-protein] synthase III C-terminal domain-containing protein [Rubrivirga sp.]|uniref:3-oxoacyl-[acyl-carrier-protein] synthase III C-terminal domain-containing protein n=1 Tax=Rubrivirga sp. TaxID=1885344 RepID=UPI003C7719A2